MTRPKDNRPASRPSRKPKRQDSKTGFDLLAYVRASAAASGVPEHVEDLAVLSRIAEMLPAPATPPAAG